MQDAKSQGLDEEVDCEHHKLVDYEFLLIKQPILPIPAWQGQREDEAEISKYCNYNHAHLIEVRHV